MSKEVLSQGEIDALLKTIEETGGEHFTDTEKEALIELANLFVEAAIGALSALTNREIGWERPEIGLNRRSIVEKTVGLGMFCQTVLMEGVVTGQLLLAIEGHLASVICDLLLGGDGSNPPELGETQLTTLREAFQTGLDASASALGEALGGRVKMTAGATSVAGAEQDELPYFSDFDPDYIFADLAGKAELPDMFEGEVHLLYPQVVAREQLRLLTAQQAAVEGDAGEAEAEPGSDSETAPAAEAGEAGRAEGTEEAGAAPKRPAKPAGKAAAAPIKAATKVVGNAARVQVQPAKFEALKAVAAGPEGPNLDLIMDVPLHLTVELGRTKMQVRQVLTLGSGAVIELDKLAGEPLDVMVNGRLIAKGEVVIINENFGVRITDIISQVERVQNLK